MNNTRNNTWIIGIIAVIVALLVAMCACMFGLAVGVGIGNARARLAIEDRAQRAPELGPPGAPAFPVMPTMPGMPAMPGLPDMPAMPDMNDLDEMMAMMNGAVVAELVVGGPAEQAGIEPGDLIIAINGDEITPDTTLPDLIGAYAPGDEVTVTVVRMGRGEMNEEEIVVTLGANPDDESVGFLGVRVVPFFQTEEPGRP